MTKNMLFKKKQRTKLENRVWWEYAQEDIRELLYESEILVENVAKWKHRFHDYAFVVFLPDVENGIPVSVEDTKEGFLVEWCSFVECKDQMLSKFFSSWRKEPGTYP